MASSGSIAQAPTDKGTPSSSVVGGIAEKQEKQQGTDAGRNWFSRILSAIVKKPQQKFGGLGDVVSYSSRRMAASRALEHELSKSKEVGVSPLFLDPLASFLAGPAAIEDARRWEEASSIAADAVADALASGRRRPTKDELVEIIKKKEEEKRGNKKTQGGSDFTIGAPLTLIALAGRSIHRGRVEASTPGAFAPGRNTGGKKGNSKDGQVIASSRNSVSLVTARHRWFDELMLDSLRGEGYGVEVRLSSADPAADGVVKVEISPRAFLGGGDSPNKRIQQVVMLGSGMDARAWRLPLPPSSKGDGGDGGIAWYDLDSEAVVDAKRRELEDAGAELTEATTGRDGKQRKRSRFPLRSATYSLVGCDMKRSPEWADKLAGAPGFDPAKPTLFCAEGLLYYLGEGAPEFLRCLSGIAAPGSVLLLDALDEAGVASAVKKAEGKGLQGQFKFGVPESLVDLQAFFAGYGFERFVAADTWDVLRERFRKDAPRRAFSRGERTSLGAAEGGLRFIAVAKGV